MILSSIILGLHFVAQTVAFQLSVPTLNKAPTPDTVLAKVNGIAIRAKDVEDLLWDVRGEEILNDVMFYQVAKMEADKLGIVVTNAEVEKAPADGSVRANPVM